MPDNDGVGRDDGVDSGGVGIERTGELKVTDAELEGSRRLGKEGEINTIPERLVDSTDGDTDGRDPLKEGTPGKEGVAGREIDVLGRLNVKEDNEMVLDGSEVDTAVNGKEGLGKLGDRATDSDEKVWEDGDRVTPEEEDEGKIPEVSDMLVDGSKVEGKDTVTEGSDPEDMDSGRPVESEDTDIEGLDMDAAGIDAVVSDSDNDIPVDGKEGTTEGRVDAIEGFMVPVVLVAGSVAVGETMGGLGAEGKPEG